MNSLFLSVLRLIIPFKKFHLFVCLGFLTFTLKGQPTLSPPAYHLIVSSYTTFESANNYVEVLHQQGLQAYIVFPNPGGSTYRVSIFGAKDRNLVENFQAQMKGRISGWIFFQEGNHPPNTSQPVFVGEEQPSDIRSRRFISPAQAPGGYMYYFILGSFDTYAAAENKARELAQNKYEPDILLPTVEIPKYRVYVYATGDRAEIEAYADRLAKTNREKGWIYTQPVVRMAYENGLPEPNTGIRGNLPGTVPPQAKPAAPGLQPPQVNYTYYLIAGSFKKLSQAQVFADRLLTEGFSPLILTPPQNTGAYRVSIYHTYSREEVDYFAQQLKNTKGGTYWIYQP